MQKLFSKNFTLVLFGQGISLFASDENLIKANALVSQINAISTLLGPVLGGFLYGTLGLMPVVFLSGAGFALAAGIEFFLKIPYIKRDRPKGLLSVIGSDFKEGVVFITKEKPIICKTLLLATFTLVPIAIALALGAPPLVSYGIITFCTVLFMVAATLFSISAVTFIQQQSPQHLVGKVSSLVVTLSLLAQPIGQALYGLLFDAFPNHVHVVILLTVAIGVVITLFFKRLFAQMEQQAA